MSVASASKLSALRELGDPIPDTAHAVSVSLPSWKSNIGYEEGEDWVLRKMRCGYPRFYIHPSIVALQELLCAQFGQPGESAILFPSTAIAQRCVQFIVSQSDRGPAQALPVCRILEMVPSSLDSESTEAQTPSSHSMLSAVFLDSRLGHVAKKFWQHTGDGISSRRAEFLSEAIIEGHLAPGEVKIPTSAGQSSIVKGPKRYRKGERPSLDGDHTQSEPTQIIEGGLGSVDLTKFVEERFGRNLDIALANKAKIAVRRRIAGALTPEQDSQTMTDSTELPSLRATAGFSQDQVYLYACGMSAIYNAHRMIMAVRGDMKSIMFGFPYTDTLKVLQKFGPGVMFYGNGSSIDLDDLESRCSAGEQFLALFCEFPGNPLLKSPDLKRIRHIADKFGFMVVVDETIGNFLNVNVLPAADVVVSSLTKVFSGDSNVMGGSLVVNPTSSYFDAMTRVLRMQYADHLWLEDAIFLERNSRDFVNRNHRINANAEALVKLLTKSKKIKQVNYPKHSASQAYYDGFRNPEGGYSGLFSISFFSTRDAITFYDVLATDKGPSLGTNFTLVSPFVILAHYHELEWVKKYGVDPDLVRVSVGLEATQHLTQVFQTAIDAIS